MRRARHYAVLIVLFAFSTYADVNHQGKVVKIADGDSLTLLVNSKQLKIRLSDLRSRIYLSAN